MMVIKLNKKVLGLGAALMGMVIGSSAANAGAQLVLLSSDGGSVVIPDNGAGDGTALVGAISYNGAVGANWILNVATGLTKPLIGTAGEGVMDLNSINLSAGAGSITMIFSDTGFTTASAQTFLELLSGGTLNSGAGNSIEFSICHEADNTTIDSAADCDVVASSGLVTTSPFADTTNGNIGSSNPFGLGIMVTITHTNDGQTSFDSELKVPEPGILGLFGFGLLGMGIAARRRRMI